MLFWNRVEIYCGYSLRDFSELRDCLNTKGISYDYKLINGSNNRTRFGSLGLNPKFKTMYYLYVHRKDYDQAMFITSNRNNKRSF